MSIKVNPFSSTAPLNAKPAKGPAEEKPAAQPAIAKDSFASSAAAPAAAAESVTVRAGDTLTKIAKRHKMTLAEILTLNPQLAEGKNRRMDGSRIYVGDVVRLKAGPAKPKPEPKPEPVKPQPPAEDPRLGELQKELKAQQAQAVIDRAKFSISRMPTPESWTSPEAAKKALDAASANLAKVPDTDADYPSLKGQVDDAYVAHQRFQSENARLSAEPDAVGQTKDEIQALSKAAVALATPEQKANMIRNLVRRDNANADAEKKIIEILLDANRQEQLGGVMDKLHGMERRILGIKDRNFMDYVLPRVMSDKNLNALEQIGTVGKRDDLIKACQEERERRVEEAQGRR